MLKTTISNPEGHLNIRLRDHDSYVTGFGKHDRVVAFCPKGDTCYARVDHKWKLGMPTLAQILKVARTLDRLPGRWIIDRIEPWPDGRSTDVYLKRFRPPENKK